MVVYESTVYPGTTEEVCVPILKKCLVCSESRGSTGIFPGADQSRGQGPHPDQYCQNCFRGHRRHLARVADLYGSIITAGIYRAPDIKTAEAAKVIENTQRDLNIALMNERP
ncbi:MAG: hypothetical protein R2874_07645 [Desulfobacterales bacterium]